jgi:N-acetylmuramoyl-L-alanine amidase
MSKFNYIIDNGHGGVIDGIYQTAPNYDKDNPKTWRKMWVHNDIPIFEGEFNRLVAERLCHKLDVGCIDNFLLVHEKEDIGLQERVERVNNLCVKHDKRNIPYILISIHGNAGGGLGDEIWTSVGETKSDNFVSKFSEGYRSVLSDRKFRKDMSDGDIDKESNFYILKHTVCPAFLTENGFFDNEEEANFMMSEEGIEAFAEAHYQGIKKIEQYTSIY